MSLWEIYKAKRLGYADDLWTSLIGHQLGGYSWLSDYETTPYLYRAMPNLSHYYNREIMEEVVGGTVAWNQLMTTSERTSNGIRSEFSNGVWSFSGTATNTYFNFGATYGSAETKPINHVMFIAWKYVANPNNFNLEFRFLNGAACLSPVENSTLNKLSNTSSSSFGCSGFNGVGATLDGTQVRVIICDLTLMFGSTIADYIYSLEQATAGAGVAFFKALFPKPYYAYNAGELKSVKGLVSHDMVGFNAWDEEWEVGDLNGATGGDYPANNRIRSKNYIPVLPSTTYYYKSPNGAFVCFYDENKQYVNIGNNTLTANATFTTGSNIHYMRFSPLTAYGTTYNHDICINLSWDGSEDGEYEPYQKWSYPLDSDLELRGIPKIENGNLYYDGDVYESDGTVTRKYGYRRFTNDAPSTIIYSVTVGTDKTRVVCNGEALPNAKSGYYLGFASNAFEHVVDSNPNIGKGAINNGFLIFGAPATVTTKEEAVAYLANLNAEFVYELATPTTETADPYTKTQNCDSGGTEEFITSGIVSVGHKSKYAEK